MVATALFQQRNTGKTENPSPQNTVIPLISSINV